MAAKTAKRLGQRRPGVFDRLTADLRGLRGRGNVAEEAGRDHLPLEKPVLPRQLQDRRSPFVDTRQLERNVAKLQLHRFAETYAAAPKNQP